jgi:hypothetical protein
VLSEDLHGGGEKGGEAPWTRDVGGDAGFPRTWASTELREMAGRLEGDDKWVPLGSESEEAHTGTDAPTRWAQLTARARGNERGRRARGLGGPKGWGNGTAGLFSFFH